MENLLIREIKNIARFTPSLIQQRLALAILCAVDVQA
jgi:hypothetical protein